MLRIRYAYAYMDFLPLYNVLNSTNRFEYNVLNKVYQSALTSTAKQPHAQVGMMIAPGSLDNPKRGFESCSMHIMCSI